LVEENGNGKSGSKDSKDFPWSGQDPQFAVPTRNRESEKRRKEKQTKEWVDEGIRDTRKRESWRKA